MTVAPLAQRKRVAAERAEQIRLGLQSTAVLYAKAVVEEDWQVLGYSSIGAWREAEFGPIRFKAHFRQEISALLTAKGWTVREIEAATGAGKSTIARDQQGVPSGTPEPPDQTPRQKAARRREEARREAAAAPPEPAGPPEPVTGPAVPQAAVQVAAAEELITATQAAIASAANQAEAKKLPLIGRDQALIDKLARRIWKDLPHGTQVTRLRPMADGRGFAFEVHITDEQQQPTGRIARVQITLDRVEDA